MAPRLSAIILAAGYSSRMGRMKALLPLGPATVLGHCIKLFQDVGIEDVVVVTGHRAAETGEIARFSGARTVYNPDFASGMFTSIQAGIRQLETRNSGFFLLPVDIPLVRSGTLKLLAASLSASPLIAYPMYAGERGHPPLISMELVSTLINPSPPEGGLRSLLAAIEKRHSDQVLDVAVADANILFDMDTPEDYEIGRQRLKHSGFPTMAECEVILHQLYPMPEKGLAHGRLVAAIAVVLCEAIQLRHPAGLDPELCRVCGWLHDIAKGHAGHEQEGGRRLRELGFDRAAEIVAAHRDLVWDPETKITEKEIVHLADKLARGGKIISLAERFEEKMALYQDNPEAIRAIRGRYELARRIGAAVEAEAGRQIEEIISFSLAACSP
jgi:CTP:molybdopterin cytidylyltransferase MocA/HD superfamily phosphodiesterase